VLYELFTGKRPFEAKTIPQLIDQQEAAELTSMTSLAADVDPGVERIIRSCLNPDPHKRPASALAVAAAIVILFALFARAGGPKCVAGTTYFNSSSSGQPLVWPLGQITYFTDQGDLSALLPNASANALVADAFNHWTSVPTAAIATSSGGQLAEDVTRAKRGQRDRAPIRVRAHRPRVAGAHDVARVALVALAEHHLTGLEAPRHRDPGDLLEILVAEGLEHGNPGEQLGRVVGARRHWARAYPPRCQAAPAPRSVTKPVA